MKHLKIFIQLTRLNKPIGFMLLFWPCSWGLAYAYSINQDYNLFINYLFLFFLGSVLMRSAGCIVNDIVDKDFDKKVKRTKTRPIAAGKITTKQSFLYVLILCGLAFLILIQFNSLTIFIGILSIIPIVIYPLMKRITWWPQIFLGLTFNWGAIIGWTAVTGSFSIYCIALYLGCIFWTVGYDTIYAHQDKIDDEFLGLKSSAIFLGKKSKPAISIFYLIFFISISFLLISLDPMNRWLSFSLLAVIGFHLIRQIYLLDIDNPEICHSIFKSNNSIGLLVFFLFFFLF